MGKVVVFSGETERLRAGESSEDLAFASASLFSLFSSHAFFSLVDQESTPPDPLSL